jgi:hypothetical protein
MSLSWNIGRCERHELLHVPQDEMEWDPSRGDYVFPDSIGEDRRNSSRITHHLVLILAAIGIPSITEKNLKEVNRRVKTFEAAYKDDRVGLWFDGEFERVEIDYGMLVRRVGMTTSGQRLTSAQFNERLVDSLVE